MKPFIFMLALLLWSFWLVFYLDARLYPAPITDSGKWIDAEVIKREIFCSGGNWHVVWMAVDGQIYVSHKREWWYQYRVCDKAKIKVYDKYIGATVPQTKPLTKPRSWERVHVQ